SASACFLQIFLLYSYGNIELCNLAVMSYDRYLAICYPLQYNTRMTLKKFAVLIAVVWLFPVSKVASMICQTAMLQVCVNIIPKVYCDNYSIVKQACSDTTVDNISGIIYTSHSTVGVICYTYVKILKVCFSGCKQTRQKALSTCTPHLASLLNFSFGCFFEIMQGRFNMRSVPNIVRIFLCLYFLTSQPLFNPVIYGLKLSKVYTLCKHLVL
ncbi:LOW QUALITY PROTEIN: olfactory receptor 140-like, partial [Epinephelus moara]|uniref:LOW QUALITY PROTEIN: olfactory receptor 140-like n=1 Tax=Epinephelus moara TaxID=300413 RepID=UPI00214E0002